ncbi:MAG: phenylalanine--tRNA ligase subunit alpha, partial [Gemmatimonadota bacterium]
MSSSLHERLEALQRDVERELRAATRPAEVEEIRVRTLGRKGRLTGEARSIGALSADERPAAGELVNRVK